MASDSFPAPETRVPEIRLRTLCPDDQRQVREDGDWVVYWMTGFRRTSWNYALEQAVAWSNALERPLVVLEALRTGYRWASDRLHAFILHGMADNAEACEDTAALYYPYLERQEDDGSGLLEALAERTCLVVSDDFPTFFLPRMLEATAERLSVPLQVVDSNGLLPLRAPDKVFARAYDLRRYLQKELPPWLEELPQADPLGELETTWGDDARAALAEIQEGWPAMTDDELDEPRSLLSDLPIDHDVPVVEGERGGAKAALERLDRFLDERLERYGEDRNDVESRATSELSAHLHFGHVSSHQIFTRLAEREDWTPMKLGDDAKGKREGWWGMSEPAESFLDELITWRELGFNMSSKCPDTYDTFESVPDWAHETIDEHRGDEREHVYTLEELEAAETHDEIWNAAQRELHQTGRIHNYLRMLWGKKIYQWSETPEDAVEAMIELNNRWALDGRNPNSYSGIFWCLGRYDRAWGPEREVFGKLRYMTSKSTRRKMKLDDYLERFGPDES